MLTPVQKIELLKLKLKATLELTQCVLAKLFPDKIAYKQVYKSYNQLNTLQQVIEKIDAKYDETKAKELDGLIGVLFVHANLGARATKKEKEFKSFFEVKEINVKDEKSFFEALEKKYEKFLTEIFGDISKKKAVRKNAPPNERTRLRSNTLDDSNTRPRWLSSSSEDDCETDTENALEKPSVQRGRPTSNAAYDTPCIRGGKVSGRVALPKVDFFNTPRDNNAMTSKKYPQHAGLEMILDSLKTCKHLDVLFQNQQARNLVSNLPAHFSNKNKLDAIAQQLVTQKPSDATLLEIIKALSESDKRKRDAPADYWRNYDLDIALVLAYLHNDKEFVAKIQEIFDPFFKFLNKALEPVKREFKEDCKIKNKKSDRAKNIFLVCIGNLGKLFIGQNELPLFFKQLLAFTKNYLEEKYRSFITDKNDIKEKTEEELIRLVLFRIVLPVLNQIFKTKYESKANTMVKAFLSIAGGFENMIQALGKVYKKSLVKNNMHEKRVSDDPTTYVMMTPLWFKSVITSEENQELALAILQLGSATLTDMYVNRPVHSVEQYQALNAYFAEQQHKLDEKITVLEKEIASAKDKQSLALAAAKTMEVDCVADQQTVGYDEVTVSQRVLTLRGGDDNAAEIRQKIVGKDEEHITQQVKQYKNEVTKLQTQLASLQQAKLFYEKMMGLFPAKGISQQPENVLHAR